MSVLSIRLVGLILLVLLLSLGTVAKGGVISPCMPGFHHRHHIHMNNKTEHRLKVTLGQADALYHAKTPPGYESWLFCTMVKKAMRPRIIWVKVKKHGKWRKFCNANIYISWKKALCMKKKGGKGVCYECKK